MKRINIAITFLFAVLALTVGALGQHEGHGDEDSVGWVPREILQRPVALRDGIGKFNDPVTTSSPEAQAFYNQGLAYLHSYVWIEAARSCNQALRSLRAKQLEAINDILNSSKHQAYKAAIDAALTKYPDDSELWLLRGNAEEPTAAGRGQRGFVGAVAYYQAALAISPANPAAEHYLVHAFESIGHPEEAVKHGEIYARLCPSVPHAQHMFGHDLRILGRSDEAIAQPFCLIESP